MVVMYRACGELCAGSAHGAFMQDPNRLKAPAILTVLCSRCTLCRRPTIAGGYDVDACQIFKCRLGWRTYYWQLHVVHDPANMLVKVDVPAGKWRSRTTKTLLFKLSEQQKKSSALEQRLQVCPDGVGTVSISRLRPGAAAERRLQGLWGRLSWYLSNAREWRGGTQQLPCDS